jgi:Kef-type K+ transport system membrane component KefB
VGIVVRSIERKVVVSAIEFGSAFELFFIVLFVYAGANLHLADLWQFAPVILVLVLVRSLLKTLMVALALRWQGVRWPAATASGLLLIPMAGLAIGLTQTSAKLVPEQAGLISAIVLGAVTLFETVGPPIAAWAFRLAGETAEQKHTNSANNTHQDWKIAGSVDVDLSAIHQATPDAAVSAAADKPEKRSRWRFWQ